MYIPCPISLHTMRLTLYVLMDSSFFDTIKLGWWVVLVYIKGSQVHICKYNCISQQCEDTTGHISSEASLFCQRLWVASLPRVNEMKICPATVERVDYILDIHEMSRGMRFPTMWYVRPAKSHISLRIRAVWSEPLLVTLRFYEC